MLKVYTLEQAEEWDAVVRSFARYDTYWLSGYVRAFRLHGDGEPLLFFFDDSRTRGINVAMKRDVAKEKCYMGRLPEGKVFDLSTPYGYGGWLIEGEETEGLFEAYSRWLTGNGIIAEFVRFHPLLRNHEACGKFYDVVPLGEVVHMELDSPEIIWDNLTSKNRNMIRKAVKNGVTIHNGRSPEDYEQFRVIYNATMERNQAEDYYFFPSEFYTSLREDLPDNARVFWAEKDGRVVASSVMLMANGRINYHLSGFLSEFGNLAATNLLLYECALWGCERGYKTFYLGGGVGSQSDSLLHFKKGFFRGELNRYHIGKRIWDQEKYDELVAMREGICSSYFPLYRAAPAAGAAEH